VVAVMETEAVVAAAEMLAAMLVETERQWAVMTADNK